MEMRTRLFRSESSFHLKKLALLLEKLPTTSPSQRSTRNENTQKIDMNVGDAALCRKSVLSEATEGNIAIIEANP